MRERARARLEDAEVECEAVSAEKLNPRTVSSRGSMSEIHSAPSRTFLWRAGEDCRKVRLASSKR
jgi:hypothetical protein